MPNKPILFFLSFWLLFPGLFLKPAQSSAAITVATNQAEIQFPDAIVFDLSVSSSQTIEEVTLRYWTSGQSCQPGGAVHQFTFDPAKTEAVSWTWDLNRSGVIPPGTELYWEWEVTDKAGTVSKIPAQSLVFNDPRQAWQTLTQDAITLQWYEGNQTFGQSLMTIAIQSLHRLTTQMGVQPSTDIWITIYPTFDDVHEVLLHTYEWTGGVAFPQYGGIITSIQKGQEDWAASVLPHELSHLVVGAATFNCQGTSLPTWLDEGLAVYAENNLTQEERSQVLAGLKNGTLPELRALEDSFSPKSDLANLEYLQAGTVADYLLSHYGTGQMSALLAAVKSGLMIDEALLQVYGFDTAGLDAVWRASLGVAVAPSPTAGTEDQASATPIPTLALWTPIVRVTPPTTQVSPSPVTTQSSSTEAVTVATPSAENDQGITQTAPAASSETTSEPEGPHLPDCSLGAAVLVILALFVRLSVKGD
jgi:hypothetical protein